MAKLLTALLSFLSYVGQYFANQQLLNAGKAEQKALTQAQVDTDVQQAVQATTVPDTARIERLRNRFDNAGTDLGS